MKNAVFSLVMLCVPALGGLGLWRGYLAFRPLSGEELNRAAWEATYRERGLPVPPAGPRDGYWGARLPPEVHDPDLGWREAEVHLPGFAEVDAQGRQRLTTPGASHELLIVGASVAWGAAASGPAESYFAHLARDLETRGLPVNLTVLAAGAWTSDNELAALRLYGFLRTPDLVLFLNGLNDLTQGKGTQDERVSRYLDHMREARDLARARGAAVVFALQPFLPQKPHQTGLERRILDLTLGHPISGVLLRNAYPRIRQGLAELAGQEGTHFLDCSDVFDREQATTFADLWHFSDPGHRMLAHRLIEGVAPLLAGPGQDRRLGPRA